VLGFAKNNEYFETVVDGYTLFGYQFNPYLAYHLSPHVRFDAGIYLQQDFGNDGYTTIAPTFSIKYQHKHMAFIFGTLESSLNHRLIEPLYDFERVLNDRLENGIQLLWQKEGLFLDTWINWQNMIYPGDPELEVFTAGLSLTQRIISRPSWQLEFPLQLIAYHQGGQIDQSSDPVTTFYNAASGVHLMGSSSGLCTSWGAKAYGTYFADADNSGIYPFDDGFGIYANAYAGTSFGLTVMATYWYGNEFVSPQGGTIYPSVNALYPQRIDEERQLFMMRLLYDVPLSSSLHLTCRFEPFYDTYSRSWQHALGVYLNLYDRFVLLRPR
jgi:hypothetical protein